MKTACNNENIGYSQSDRYGVITNGIKTKKPTNCDCSSLVRACVKEATGKDPGDFTTANAVSKLKATGLFQQAIPYTPSIQLFTGDILCTKSKGHIVIITEGNSRVQEAKPSPTLTLVSIKIGNMKINTEGLALIKSFEGCRLSAYKVTPSEKFWTIGYGHNGADVKQGMTITMATANSLLLADITKFEQAVNATGLKLSSNQFSALVSFTYNCGAGNLKKLIANRTLPQIADAILLYNKSGGKVLEGLKRRRKAERALFLKE